MLDFQILKFMVAARIEMTNVHHIPISSKSAKRLLTWRIKNFQNDGRPPSWIFLAHSANLPTGQYILPSVISSFFLFFYWTDFHDFFHQMEGICMTFLDPVQCLARDVIYTFRAYAMMPVSVCSSVCDVCALWSQGAMDPGYLCML